MLEILSNIRIYVKVSVINNMSKYNGNKMVSWDLQGGSHPKFKVDMDTAQSLYTLKFQSVQGLPRMDIYERNI